MKPKFMVTFVSIILFFFTSFCIFPLLDLEKNTHDFVLETKQITIPGFPGAFNAAITQWRGSVLMCFRVRDEDMISTFDIGFVWLDKNFNPISSPRILNIRSENSLLFSQNQDPRLIVINDQLYIVYSNLVKIDQLITRRMFVAQVKIENDNFFIEEPVCLHPFEGWSKRWEKNWVPFNYHEHLLLAYSLLPHRIMQPSLETGKCETIHATNSLINWSWGELRGGTPAFLEGNEYVAFFHSSTDMMTLQSGGKKMTHYFMGAYTFSAEPPFEVTRISPEPIVGKNFYNGPTYTTWKPLRVVFPVGCISDENYLWVTYGRQDFEIWVAKLDKKALFESLISCPKGINEIIDSQALSLAQNETQNESDLYMDYSRDS